MPNETQMTTRTTQAIEDVRAAALLDESARGWGREYPGSPMVDADFVVDDALRATLRRFKRAWLDCRGLGVDTEFTERLAAVKCLYVDLAAHFRMPVPEVAHRGDRYGFSGGSSYSGETHTILLTGNLSIITALHEFTHARGYGETAAVWWSVNCFRVVWPRAYERLVQDGGHVLVRRDHHTLGQARQQIEVLSAREISPTETVEQLVAAGVVPGAGDDGDGN